MLKGTSCMDRDPLYERILGCLLVAALGDALGAPTEGCSRADIIRRYGGLVRDFQPRAADACAAGLRPGEVTYDTSQLLAFARAWWACPTAPRCGWRRPGWCVRAISSALSGWRGCVASRRTTRRSPPRRPVLSLAGSRSR